ncbi:50S ribosomal protein L25 [Paenibacillus sp. 32352]|uniref:50S ribosomal protein L25 n=1 Tax=Paenibacillus sp. 32352 TaxID=1969111 RepID=UPI0009AC6AE4|nr:50S ribosomal protein L25 [Paenibacillus sp. 32352]
MTTRFQAEPRVPLNSSGLRELRRSGRLPGVIFRKHAENERIHISATQFQKWLKQGGSGFIELHFEGEGSLTVLLEDFQRDPVTRDLLHVDFQQVQMGERIRTKIPVKFKGTPIGTKEGGVVQIQCSAIEVEALPKHLPDVVELNISTMGIGETLYVKDVEFASEVTVISEAHEFLLSVVKP